MENINKIIDMIKVKYLMDKDLFFVALLLDELIVVNRDDIHIAGVFCNKTDNKVYLGINLESIEKENISTKLIELILIHECLHCILKHFERIENRNPKIFNIACDYIINGAIIKYFENNNIYQSAINEFKKLGLFEKKYVNELEEILYEKLIQDEQNKNHQNKNNENNDNDSNSNSSNSNVNNSNGVNNDNDQYEYDDISDILNSKNSRNIGINKIPSLKNYDISKTNKQLYQKISDIITATVNISKTPEKGSENALINVILKFKKTYNPKRLSEILRKSIINAISNNSEYSWAKPRITGLSMGQLLPGEVNEISGYNNLIIAIDESGSITNENLETIIPLLVELSKKFKKIHLIKHDYTINFYKVYSKSDLSDLENVNDLKRDLLVRHSCGGTSHKDVFLKINEIAKKCVDEISVGVIISDMISDIDTTKHLLKKRIPMIYINVNNL